MAGVVLAEAADARVANGGALRAFGLWLLRLPRLCRRRREIAAAAQRGGRRRGGMVGAVLAEAANARVADGGALRFFVLWLPRLPRPRHRRREITAAAQRGGRRREKVAGGVLAEAADARVADGGALRAFGLWLLRLPRLRCRRREIAAAAQRGGWRRDGMVGGVLAKAADARVADGGALRAYVLWLPRLPRPRCRRREISAAAQRGGRQRDGMVGGVLAEAADARVADGGALRAFVLWLPRLPRLRCRRREIAAAAARTRRQDGGDY